MSFLILSQVGSGTRWHSLYAEGREGTGPPNVKFQLSWKVDGKPGYLISTYDDSAQPPPGVTRKWTLDTTKSWPEAIRFRKLSVYENPCNDMWAVGDGYRKQFPHLLFVGEGIRKDRPVTVVWELSDEMSRVPRRVLTLFRTDASHLDMPSHGSHEMGSIILEWAQVGWLPASERPKGLRMSSVVTRTWSFHSSPDFPPDASRTITATRWRLVRSRKQLT